MGKFEQDVLKYLKNDKHKQAPKQLRGVNAKQSPCKALEMNKTLNNLNQTWRVD